MSLTQIEKQRRRRKYEIRTSRSIWNRLNELCKKAGARPKDTLRGVNKTRRFEIALRETP